MGIDILSIRKRGMAMVALYKQTKVPLSLSTSQSWKLPNVRYDESASPDHHGNRIPQNKESLKPREGICIEMHQYLVNSSPLVRSKPAYQ